MRITIKVHAMYLGNKRITIITCTDDDTQRQVMIGIMKEKE